ncbi:hypothetical protein, partial [Metapseudomonas otitidis]|uniref:hypothetical protein n=1 Tax=Metapseudomonas otitidis TaxID=319939 RepID=UPI002810A4DC
WSEGTRRSRAGTPSSDAGASLFGFFFVGGIPTTEKRDSPGKAKKVTSTELDNQLGSATKH